VTPRRADARLRRDHYRRRDGTLRSSLIMALLL
jgi:hypothetical protein